MVVASAALALLVAIVFVVLVVAIREQRHSARLAIKSEQAITAGVSLEKLAIDLETGVRGYVASGNLSLLEPYTNSRASYPAQAQALERLVAQDSKAHAQVLGIRGAINDYVNLYSIPIVSLAKDNLNVARKRDREQHRARPDRRDPGAVQQPLRHRARRRGDPHRPGQRPLAGGGVARDRRAGGRPGLDRRAGGVPPSRDRAARCATWRVERSGWLRAT